jgi:hypothetical protein
MRRTPSAAGLAALGILLLAIGTSPSPAQTALAPAPARAAAWRQDVDSAEARITRIHPRPWAHVTQAAFRRAAAELRASVPRLSDPEALVGLMRLVASVRDGHTYITDLGPTGARWFPVRFYRFEDGLFVTAATPAVPGLPGSRVLRVGRLSADSAEARILTVASGDNDFSRREELGLMSSAIVLDGLHVTDDTTHLTLEVESPGGARRAVQLEASASDGTQDWRQRGEFWAPPGQQLVTAFAGRAPSTFRTPPGNPDLPLHLRLRLAYWWTAVLDSGFVYFQLNAVAAQPSYAPKSLLQTVREMMAYVDTATPRPARLILDLRYNSGGDGSLNARIVNEIIKRDSSVNRRGRLFVLTGRKTFSAAVDLTLEILRHTDAILVGEPMGASRQAAGDPMDGVLPAHRIGLAISTHYLPVSPDSSPVVEVEVPAPFTGADYFAGRDPALMAILAEPAPMPTIADVLRTEGVAAARRLWERQSARYGLIPWWQPFRQSEMNDLGYDLIGEHRAADAVIAFELNTERFGDRWETWDSLGDGYRAAGRNADALAAYRHALALAPDNWNSAAQRRAIAELSATAR